MCSIYKTVLKSSDIIDETLQTDAQSATKSAIEEMSKSIKSKAIERVSISEDGEAETYLQIPESIGMNRMIGLAVGEDPSTAKALVTPFDVEHWRNVQFKKIKDSSTMTDAEIKELLKVMEDQWPVQASYGEKIHSLFQSMVDRSVKFDNTKGAILPDKVVEVLRTQFRAVLEKLQEQHGSDAIFLTEVPIISKDVDDALKNAGYNSINGRIDLMVIDKDGCAHIYDFKVSKKSVGNWKENDNKRIGANEWTSSKKLSVGYQLEGYAAILKQYGIRVKTRGVIPVTIAYKMDGEKIVGIDTENQYIDGAEIETENLIGFSLDNDKEITPVATAAQRQKIEKFLPTTSLLDDVDLMKTIQEPMTKFFPRYSIETQVQRKSLDVDAFRKSSKVSDVSSTSADGMRGYKFSFYDKYTKLRVYAKTEEELRDKIAKYLEKENDARFNELRVLADTITDIQDGVDVAESLGNDESKYKGPYCQRIFFKYLRNGWQLVKNQQFISAGVFVFTRGNVMEIVSIAHNSTHSVCDLGKGTSLLGTTRANYDVDSHEVLSATNGNIDLMKVMSLINGSRELFEKYQISKVSSFNIWEQTGCSYYSEILLKNFKELCDEHGVKCNLSSKNFSGVLQSTVREVRDILGEELVSHIGGDWEVTKSMDDIIQGVPWILDRMKQLINLRTDVKGKSTLLDAIERGQLNFDDPIQLSYALLGGALNQINNYQSYIEKDPALWLDFDGKRMYGGAYVNSAGNSSSLNIQAIGQMFSVAETQIRRKELAFESKIRPALEALYKSKDRSALIGGEVRYFQNCFEKGADGKISKLFTIKHADDTSLSREESNFIKVFLEIVNDFRFNGDEEKIEQAKVDGTYWECPLVMGEVQTQIYQKGFGKAIKSSFDEAINFLRLLPGQEENYKVARQKAEVYNKFKMDANSRQAILDKYGTEGLETQLEHVLRGMIHAYSTEEVLNEYLPRMQALKFTLQYYKHMFGVETEHMNDIIEKFITINAYGQPIMDKNLHFAYKCLSTVRNITGATVLGWNLRSGIRELMQGIWVHLSRSMAEAYGKNQFTKGELAKAWGIIFKETMKNPNTLTLIDALNVEYGMANADPHEVGELLSDSRSGILNFKSDTLYILNRVPDGFHRIGILVAKMLHDGSWGAHKMVDNQLVYDFKSDERFSLLNDPKADKNSEKYREQRGLYMTMLEQFNREGWHLKVGDDLPRAYTIQEGTSIKAFAELCFGHYDRSTQMLCKHMFLGSFFLQFRTFLSSKLEQWILKPGTYNQGSYEIKTNKDGIRYVRIYTNDENGVPDVRIDLETNVKPGDNWDYLKVWKGRFMEGMLYSMWDFTKAAWTMDWKKLKELWGNQTKQANFKLFLWDMIFMSIAMWIIDALFLSNDDIELGAGGHMAATALYTSFSDGPIWGVLGSMFGDLNPPMYTNAKNLVLNTWQALSGKKDISKALYSSFGALGDLKYATDLV